MAEVELRFEAVFALDLLLLLCHNLGDLAFDLVHHLLLHLFVDGGLGLLNLAAVLHRVRAHLVLHLAGVQVSSHFLLLSPENLIF